jgi:tripartite-type tricarboxylate transporter receptor subunit TctC
LIDLRALRIRVLLTCLLPACFAGASAWCAYPEKPVRIIVPSPPAGGNDIIARLAGQKLAEAWGKQVLIDNRPGAGGAIAFEMAARAEPNGYTLLLGSTNFTTLPDMTKVNYDPIKDFVPVSLMATSMNILLIHPSVPVTSTKALIALAKANPGKLSYGTTAATSTHLGAELFKATAGVDILRVQYKGVAQAMLDVTAGNIDLTFSNPAASISYIQSGRLRALAVTGARRSSMLPEVPTIAESAIPGFEASTWWGILAPSGTPAVIVAEVNAQLARAFTQRDVTDRIAALGADPVGGAPKRLAEHLNAEIPKWRQVIRTANIRL